MSKEDYPYPEDEFDTLGAKRVPQGVHREPAPRWRQWLPFLLVLVLVPLLTFGVVKYFADTSSDEPTPTAEESETAAPDEGDGEDGNGEETSGEDDGETDPEADGTEEPGEEDTDEEDPGEDDPADSEDLNLDTSVLILNGARVQGLAGEVAEALTDEGWRQTEADNYAQAAPAETTLYYTSEEFAAEAEAVGEQLGITNLVESSSAASNGIVIVLRADFSMPTGP